MANIEGTITTSGLGSNRKSGTPRSQDSQVSLRSGGSPAMASATGLVDPRLAGSISNVNISHRQNVKALTLQTPQDTGPIIDPRVVQEASRDLSNAAMGYADRVATQKAREGVLKYRDMLFESFNGEEGFRQTKGFEATDGYQTYAKDVDSGMKSLLDTMDPATRQKAVMSMYSIRENYLSKASEHSRQEGDQLDKDLRSSENLSYARQLRAMPMDALSAPDGTPSILKSQVIESQDNYEKGLKMWQGMVMTAAEGIYLDGREKDTGGDAGLSDGLEDLKLYRDTVGVSELGPEDMNKLDTYIDQKEAQEITAYNKRIDDRDTLNEKAAVTKKSNNLALLYQGMYSGDPVKLISPQDVFDMEMIGAIPKGSALAYQKNFNTLTKKGPETLDRYEYMNLKARVEASDPKALELLSQSSLPTAEFKELLKLDSSLKKEGYKESYTKAKNQISAFVVGDGKMGSMDMVNIYIDGGQPDGVERWREDQALQSFTAEFDRTGDFEKSMKVVRDQWSNAEISLDKLPTFWDGKRPVDTEGLIDQVNRLVQGKAGGKYDETEYNRQMRIARLYEEMIIKGVKQ